MDIYVNTSSLNSYGSVVNGLGSDYNTEISNIYSTIDTLNNGWKGLNATTFNTTFKGYEQDLRKLGEVVRNIGADLITIAKVYDTTQANLTDLAGKL